MSSAILTKLGLGKLDIGIILIGITVITVALLIVVIILLVQNSKLRNTYNKFMTGSKAKSLESLMHDLVKRVDVLTSASKEHAEAIDEIFHKHESAYQKMGLLKYDAFKEMGGKLSCCLCLLDENDNGFIMNNVHSSAGCYSYTKRIKSGKCDLDLSPEEKTTLDRAIANDTGIQEA